MRQVSAAIEIGTSKVACTIAESGAYEGFNLLGASTIEYSGYTRRGWIEPKEIKYVVASALHEAQKQVGIRVRYVSIGVPADFTEVVCRKVSLNLGKPRRISEDDIALMFKRGESFTAYKNYIVAHRCPIYFSVNENRRTLDPLNMMGDRLSAMVSYVLVNRSFTDSVANHLQKCGYEVESCIASVLAQGVAFIPAEVRDKTAILIDMGHRITSVTVFKGDGILFHSSIPLGGLHITKDLAITLRVPDEIAEQLKRRAIYGLSVSGDDWYEIMSKETYQLYRFPMLQVQEIINARVYEICGLIKKMLASSGCILPEYVEAFISGGAAEMRGIREFMQKALGRNVTVIQPRSTRLNNACYSAALGVTEFMMDKYVQEKISIWEQIKQIFRK